LALHKTNKRYILIIRVFDELSFIKASGVYLIKCIFINQLNPEVFIIDLFPRFKLYSPFNVLELE
jgi:hypothetical protein